MIGVELELLAPPGHTRFDVARAIADRLRGRVSYGLKHIVDAVARDGRARCSLSMAAQVCAADGRTLCTVVDDVTIRGWPTPPPGDGPGKLPLVVIDDVRLSKWLEKRSFVADAIDVARVVGPLLEAFDAVMEAQNDERVARVLDPWGHVLALVAHEPAAHGRVCEIVTRPCSDNDERDGIVGAALAAAGALGCTVPRQAALHVHVDSEPWRTTRGLRTLVASWDACREEILARLRPNPRCVKLGPFPADCVRVARECPPHMPLPTLCAAFKMAGAKKELDLNILGAIETHPVQPTVEVRCLPMSLVLNDVLASIEEATAILDDIRAAC